MTEARIRRGLCGTVLLGCVMCVPGTISGQAPEGEYRFWVLGGAGETDTVAVGRFVLGPPDWDPSLLPDSLRERVGRDDMLLLQDGAEPTACFGFERSRPWVHDREFYAGIYEAGLSVWTLREGTVELPVYQSADARQVLRWDASGPEVAGRVHQWDWGLNRGSWEWLPFGAVRVGPPTVAACREVLESGVERPPRFP